MNQKSPLRRLGIALSAAVLIFSLCRIVTELNNYRDARNVYSQLARDSVTEPPADDTDAEAPTAEAVPISVDFDALREQYPDLCGWLYCENTAINYPIMQGDDNDEYLRALPDGTYSAGGSLFVDYRANADFTDLRTVIYGHNMYDGSMFSALSDYADDAYAAAHDTLFLLTPSDSLRLEVIAGLRVSYTCDLYSPLQTPEQLAEFIASARNDSFFTPMHINTEYSAVCCLSTCVHNSTARTVIICGITPCG